MVARDSGFVQNYCDSFVSSYTPNLFWEQLLNYIVNINLVVLLKNLPSILLFLTKI